MQVKFIIFAKTSLKFVSQEIDKVYDTMGTRINYNSNSKLYSYRVTIQWDYSQDKPYKVDTIRKKHRMYLHIYFNSEKAVNDELKFINMLDRLENELHFTGMM